MRCRRPLEHEFFSEDAMVGESGAGVQNKTVPGLHQFRTLRKWIF